MLVMILDRSEQNRWAGLGGCGSEAYGAFQQGSKCVPDDDGKTIAVSAFKLHNPELIERVASWRSRASW